MAFLSARWRGRDLRSRHRQSGRRIAPPCGILFRTALSGRHKIHAVATATTALRRPVIDPTGNAVRHETSVAIRRSSGSVAGRQGMVMTIPDEQLQRLLRDADAPYAVNLTTKGDRHMSVDDGGRSLSRSSGTRNPMTHWKRPRTPTSPVSGVRSSETHIRSTGLPRLRRPRSRPQLRGRDRLQRAFDEREWRGVFEPLADQDSSPQVRVDPRAARSCGPAADSDMAPEPLYTEARFFMATPSDPLRG